MERRFENLLPDAIQAEKELAPVIYVPVGSLEWHGWHMATGNDAIKAHEICLEAAETTGGLVLPPLFFGTGGGHYDYPTSIMVSEAALRPLLQEVLQRLADLEYRVIVCITGHYPGEQVDLVKSVAASVTAPPGTTIFALAEHEAYTLERRADHAGKWETSILAALRPELVDMDQFAEHAEDPLRGVHFTEPREATETLGRETVDGIVKTLADWVARALEKTAAEEGVGIDDE